MSLLRSIRRRWPPRRATYSLAAVIISCVYFTTTMGMVLGPVSESQELFRRFERAKAAYVAEDVFLQALKHPSLSSKGTVDLFEGALSKFPDRIVEVELRRHLNGSELRCFLDREQESLEFRASYVEGAMPNAFAFAVGQADTGLDDLTKQEGVTVKGFARRLSRTPDARNVFPLSIPGPWDEHQDLMVHAGAFLDRRGVEDVNLGNFRLAGDLPLEYLTEPTDRDDFAFGREHASKFVASFRHGVAYRGLIIRVLGNLWIGKPGSTLLVETLGRPIIIKATGNIYILGDIQMVGPKDSMYLIAGSRDKVTFRDSNGNGSRDPGEILLGTTTLDPSSFRLRPREGSGTIYVGLGNRGRPNVHASLLSHHDIVIAQPGAEITGAVLAGDKVLRVGGKNAGALLLTAETRFQDPTLPIRGLPITPGSEKQKRLTEVRLHSTNPETNL